MRELALPAFRPAAPPQPLGADEIHLWFLPQWLGPARQAAESLPVRTLLAHYAAVDPARLALQRDAHGKPRLAGGELEFNLSHSGEALLIALSRRQPLGVDLEVPRRPRPVLELAQRFFHPAESAALAALPGQHQGAAFLQLWACKEAVLKAHGGGISLGLERVVFALDEAGAVRSVTATHAPLAADGWHVIRLAFDDGACGALAWRGADLRVSAFRSG